LKDELEAVLNAAIAGARSPEDTVFLLTYADVCWRMLTYAAQRHHRWPALS
jgi:hypothetical protein